VASINLLTTKIAPKSSVVQTSNTLKIIGLVWTIIFFVGILVTISIFLINSQQIRSSLSRQEQLKSVIKSLEKTEQTYVLIKDRASKINEIYQEGNATDELVYFYSFVTSLPEGTSIDNLTIISGIVESNILFNSSSVLTEGLALLLTGEEYKRVEMEAFSFSPAVGYKLSLKFIR
jgi:Ni,Fe-hydrogenase I cytochrome b subunit